MKFGSEIAHKSQPEPIKIYNIFLHRFILSIWLQNGGQTSGTFDDFGVREPRIPPRGIEALILDGSKAPYGPKAPQAQGSPQAPSKVQILFKEPSYCPD